jgi:hypothetical protein
MRLSQGFRMVTPGNEAGLLNQACKAALETIKGAQAGTNKPTGASGY